MLKWWEELGFIHAFCPFLSCMDTSAFSLQVNLGARCDDGCVRMRVCYDISPFTALPRAATSQRVVADVRYPSAVFIEVRYGSSFSFPFEDTRSILVEVCLVRGSCTRNINPRVRWLVYHTHCLR